MASLEIADRFPPRLQPRRRLAYRRQRRDLRTHTRPDRHLTKGTTMTAVARLLPANPPDTATAGAVTGGPRLVLRIEGAVLLVAALLAFAAAGQAWWLLPAVLFLPDVFMAGYARSTRFGALTYNLAHSYPLPAALSAVALWQDAPVVQAIALLWFAHIGMDRLLGYGLKHDHGFSHTHLGTIGSTSA
jgi:hypothetical protein